MPILRPLVVVLLGARPRPRPRPRLHCGDKIPARESRAERKPERARRISYRKILAASGGRRGVGLAAFSLMFLPFSFPRRLFRIFSPQRVETMGSPPPSVDALSFTPPGGKKNSLPLSPSPVPSKKKETQQNASKKSPKIFHWLRIHEEVFFVLDFRSQS